MAIFMHSEYEEIVTVTFFMHCCSLEIVLTHIFDLSSVNLTPNLPVDYDNSDYNFMGGASSKPSYHYRTHHFLTSCTDNCEFLL